MYQRGRPEDQEFGLVELLYRRYLRDHWIEGHFSDLGFRFPRQSLNRQKYSEPEDVLLSDEGTYHVGYGVLEFFVSDIPTRLQAPGTHVFVFFPKHVPKALNYAHSELWCDTEQQTGSYVEPSSIIKKLLRAKLSQHVSIRIIASA
jgi:hypothetical protein